MKQYTEDTVVEAGFDHTKFVSGEQFEKILNELGIGMGDMTVDGEREAFVWECKDGIIVTHADPITGEHYKNGMEEEGLASYIGITGKIEWVAKAYLLIKNNAPYTKDSEFGERGYI